MTTINEILKVPKPVRMNNPDDTDHPWTGILRNRTGAEERGDEGERDYFRVIDEIEYDDKTKRIRLAYYWKHHEAPDDEWAWGSQDTFSATKNLFSELLKK